MATRIRRILGRPAATSVSRRVRTAAETPPFQWGLDPHARATFPNPQPAKAGALIARGFILGRPASTAGGLSPAGPSPTSRPPLPTIWAPRQDASHPRQTKSPDSRASRHVLGPAKLGIELAQWMVITTATSRRFRSVVDPPFVMRLDPCSKFGVGTESLHVDDAIQPYEPMKMNGAPLC